MQESLAEQAAVFFRSEPGFARLIPLLAEKYRSLGRFGGSVSLTGLSEEEAAAFTAFFRRPFRAGEGASIPFSAFLAALEKTRFCGADPLAVIECCIGTTLLGKKTERLHREQTQADMLADLSGRYPQALAQRWLGQLRASGSLLEEDREAIGLVVQALARLPADYERLPVFARNLCADPHALDASRPVGRLLVRALIQLSNTARDERLTSVEAANEALYRFGLLRDDVQSFITCAGLAAKTAEGCNRQYWKTAWDEGAVLNVPLREMIKTRTISPACGGRNVFIVENSGVFSTLIDMFAARGQLPPLVCTHGQFRLAAWAAVERMVAADCCLWYSGDFDPEGLSTAARLKARFPANVRFWRYSAADYYASISGVTISPERLKKLDKLDTAELAAVSAQISKKGYAGYQEALVDALAADIHQGTVLDLN